ncbi:MAG: AsnC family transcriptional regulator [Rhodobacterales bacterium]|nr:MAG: AsnC family transcriptional regulator [Rhodobacterales bacterium]
MLDLDGKSREILRILQQDGRISNVELAARVALSPSACLRRVQELERSGVVSGYRAVVNRQKTGNGFTAYVTVGLSDHSKKSQQRFEHAMAAASEVRECHNIAGAYEYLLRVEVADLVSYKAFHTDILGTVPNVNSITSYMVMGSPKDERG